MTHEPFVGSSQLRKEDHRLVTGRGRFVGDIGGGGEVDVVLP